MVRAEALAAQGTGERALPGREASAHLENAPGGADDDVLRLVEGVALLGDPGGRTGGVPRTFQPRRLVRRGLVSEGGCERARAERGKRAHLSPPQRPAALNRAVWQTLLATERTCPGDRVSCRLGRGRRQSRSAGTAHLQRQLARRLKDNRPRALRTGALGCLGLVGADCVHLRCGAGRRQGAQ